MMASVQDAVKAQCFVQSTSWQRWSLGAVLDSSRVAVSGYSEIALIDLRVQSTLPRRIGV